MTTFKVGDKVTHPITGDTVLTVEYSFRQGTTAIDTLRAMAGAKAFIEAPIAEFTPYTPPRVSTDVLQIRMAGAYHNWLNRPDNVHSLPYVQALAEAATALAERLDEEYQQELAVQT